MERTKLEHVRTHLVGSGRHDSPRGTQLAETVDYILKAVARRGWDAEYHDIDDFRFLRQDRRTREAITVELYEQYILPRRHEFEWKILLEITTEIVQSQPAAFVGIAVASGVVGNAAYDVLRVLCGYAAERIADILGGGAAERAAAFRAIANDSAAVASFFASRDAARIEEVERVTKVAREKLHPLLKLAGMVHIRRGHGTCMWVIPDSAAFSAWAKRLSAPENERAPGVSS